MNKIRKSFGFSFLICFLTLIFSSVSYLNSFGNYKETTLIDTAGCKTCEMCRDSTSHKCQDSIPRYNRKDWKHWSDADNDGDNTRKEILISESYIPVVEFIDHAGKKRMKGLWKCRYTGETFHDTRELDVDHLVPLKEAHVSGAWRWSRNKKEEYANYLQDSDHLVAVKGSVNRQKGSKDPASWMPLKDPCSYAIAWIRVKEKWKLSYDENETKALMRALATCPQVYEK